MPVLRVYRADVPVAEVDLSAGGLSVGARPGDELRLDELGVRVGGDAGGRVEARGPGWVFLRRDAPPSAAPTDLSPGHRVAVGDGFVEVLASASEAPVLDLAGLPPDEPLPAATPAPTAVGGAADRLRLLGDVVRVLDGGGGEQEAFAAALDGAFRLVRAQRGFAGVLEPDGKTLRVLASRNLDPGDPRASVSRSVLDAVLREGKDVYSSNAPVDIPTSSIILRRIRSVIGLPLKAGGRVAGLLYVDGGEGLRPLSEDDLEFLRLLAALVSRRIWEEDRLREAQAAQRDLEGRHAVREAVDEEDLAWGSPAMRRVRDEAERLARAYRGRSLPVLISGESGTGKEVLARWLHARLEGGKGRFVPVNCAAIPRDLAESELFGIEQGVATGVLRRLGKIQQADGGTLFLDEVGEMDLPVQAKLLRSLETRRIQRVGGRDEIEVDTRVISATNRPLDAAIRAGKFREDLYWRLCGLELRMPPLRERIEDVPALAALFLRRFAKEYGVPVEGLTPAAMERLLAYAWPGNVRELRQRIGAMVVLSRGRLLDVADLPPAIRDPQRAAAAEPAAPVEVAGGATAPVAPVGAFAPAGKSLAEVELAHIHDVLRSVGGDAAKAAEILGIHRKTLQRKLKGEGADEGAD